MQRRALITGAGGMLAQDLATAAQRTFEVIALTREELDITNRSELDVAFTQAHPAVVFNCAAWTDVDGAETAGRQALSVNGEGAGHVASAAAAVGAWTIHISSDYVFDGAKRRQYVESDAPGPLSVYGRSKLAGEQAVAAAAPEAHTIVRSSWLFGPRGRSFPDTILRLAAERDELAVVDDQVGSPTFTGHLAEVLADIARADPPLGVVHVAGQGSCSWFQFAGEILATAGVECSVKPVSTEQMPRPARRPAYSALSSERPDAPRLPHWRQGLAGFLAARVAT